MSFKSLRIVGAEDEDGEEGCDETDGGHDFNVDGCDDGEFVDYDEFIAADESAHMYGATSADEVSWLRAVIIEGEKGTSGKTILPCDELDKALMPWEIQNKFSAVLGDIFHAMNRTRVPSKHVATKAYYSALRNAFLIWNPEKVKKFDEKLRAAGKTPEEIKAMKYFQPHLYDECVERHAPAPKLLYYRVRAVYTLFGNIVDKKTNKPLFNKTAWKKANQVLKEILQGLYSDPPGLNLYTKKKSRDGRTVMKNKYGMELIECIRGTNRVEAYHKHLVPSIRSRNVGVRRADALLSNKRHRHNQPISERRRANFPRLGMFSTWKINQLQQLYLDNHGTILYPGLMNASAYKSTPESFDTVALHHAELHDALKARREQLGEILS